VTEERFLRPAVLRGIFFDLDNTLIDRAAALEGYIAELARRFPRALGTSEARAHLRGLDDRGYRDRPEFCRAVVAAFPALGMSPAAFWEDFAAGLARSVVRHQAVVDLVEELGRRYRLAVVTNGGGARQREKLARAGLAGIVGDLFISEEVGAEKPDPRIFRLALQQTGLAAGQVLFVGDDPARDIAGAQGAGLVTCWVSWGRSYPAGLPPATMTIDTLEQLAGRLGS
jgi:putative hydrolase of the HAD superfamily